MTRVYTFVTPEEAAEMVKLHRQGHSTCFIADYMGRSRKSVGHVLSEAGLVSNGGGQISLDGYRAQIAAWRAAGESYPVIARRIGCAHSSVREACVRWGVKPPRQVNPKECARCEILLAAAPAGHNGLCGWCVAEIGEGGMGKHLGATLTNAWRPIRSQDDLPAAGRWCLVTVGNNVCVAQWLTMGGDDAMWEVVWPLSLAENIRVDASWGLCERRVVAWRPLPLPYKEEAE